MKQIPLKIIILSIVTPALVALGALTLSQPVNAQTVKDELCKGSLGDETAVFVITDPATQAGHCEVPSQTPPRGLFGDGSLFQGISNTLIFIIGAISVVMLIIGGIRFVVSAGDANGVTAARNTILYAVIGIVVALLAFALVNFVIKQLL